MPLFKFSYLDHSYNHAWLGLERSIQFDFLAEHLPDSSELYLETIPVFEFSIDEIPPLEIPLLDFFFDATDRTVDYAEMEFAIPNVGIFLSDTEEVPVELSLNLLIGFDPQITCSVPEFNVATINLGDFSVIPEFETYVPVISEILLDIPSIDVEFEVFEPVLCSVGLRLPLGRFDLRAIFDDVARMNLRLGFPLFRFDVYEQGHFGQMEFSIPAASFRFDVEFDSDQDFDDYIIKFYYLSWMLEMLKALSPEDADDLVIRFKG